MSGPLIGRRRETGCAGGDARERPVFPARTAGLPRVVLGTGDGAVRPRPGSVPVVLPGRRQVLAAHRAGARRGPRARWPGRLALAVARRAARAACRRPASAAGARTASRPMPATGAGRMRYLARHLAIARLSPSRAAGSGHDTGAAVTCAFTAMARIWRGCPGIPGAAGMAWRDWRWRAAGASCGQPLVPTGPQRPARFFSNHAVLAGEVFTFGADLGRWGLAGVLPTG